MAALSLFSKLHKSLLGNVIAYSHCKPCTRISNSKVLFRTFYLFFNKVATPDLILFVYTGDRRYAGTDNNVEVILHGIDGKSSKPIKLNSSFSNDLERGQTRMYKPPVDAIKDLGRFTEIQSLEIWKDATLGAISDDWFVDKIMVENRTTKKMFAFPFFRWIKSGNRYHIKQFDTSLPQFDEHRDQRKKELEDKKKAYQYDQKIPGGPVQIKSLPADENFPFDYAWEITKSKFYLKALGKLSVLTKCDFNKIEDIHGMYDKQDFLKPSGSEGWKDDAVFARKRTNSINPTLIRRFTSVPDKFPVTDGLLAPLLENLTMQQAIERKRLYYCDIAILEGIYCKPGNIVCNPFLLMFVDSKKHLRPIAIQLFQEPGPENPIFTPLDDPMTWTIVKMWYDNADCCYHQALTHLGLTHIMMEGVAIAANRNLSPSHPVFKLLAPHFLYIIAINTRALQTLVIPDGWVDKTMQYGAKGLLELMTKGFDSWRMDVHGHLPEDLRARGVDDPEGLPNFYYRDDALLLFNAIKKYTSSYVDLYYKSKEMLLGDEELQAWTQELVKERNKSDGGAGLKGVPGNGKISSNEDLANILTSVIFTCSCSHASANFGQYDQYGYPPNYPTVMKGKPPTSKSVKMTEKDIVDTLPCKVITQDVMTVTKILSSKGTNSLGDFEVQYVFDPEALKIVDEFRKDLAEISKKIKTRNKQVEYPYDDFLPEHIPNSISI